MSTATPVDRETASKLNPLIGTLVGDTLDMVSSVVTDMGYLLSEIDSPPEGTDPQFRSMYLFCGVIASALQYESANHAAEHAAQSQGVAA